MIVKIGADISEFDKKLADTTAKLENAAQRIQAVGQTMSTFITLPTLAAGAASIKMASDYEESLNKVNVAFDYAAGQVTAWAETSIEKMGMASGSALDAAALFGDMATSMGINRDEAAKMSMSLVQLGADLASFKNVPIQQAMYALNGVFTGETESLKMLGVVMTQANLQAFALTQGITKQVEKMSQAEQVTLRYQYILANTTNAQGDFLRTNDGVANQMRIFQESLKQLGTEFGRTVLPVFNEIIKKLNGFLFALQQLSPETQKFIVYATLITAAIGPVLLALAGAISAFGYAQAAIAGFTAMFPVAAAGITLLLPTIALAVLAIGSLTVAFLQWQKHGDKITLWAKNFVSNVVYDHQIMASKIKIILGEITSSVLQFLINTVGKFGDIGNSFMELKKNIDATIQGNKIEMMATQSAKSTENWRYQTEMLNLSMDELIDKQNKNAGKTDWMTNSNLIKNGISTEAAKLLDEQRIAAAKLAEEQKKAAEAAKKLAEEQAKLEAQQKKAQDKLAKEMAAQQAKVVAEQKKITDKARADELKAQAEFDKQQAKLMQEINKKTIEEKKNYSEMAINEANNLGNALISALKSNYDEEQKLQKDKLDEEQRTASRAYEYLVKDTRESNQKKIESYRDAADEQIKQIKRATAFEIDSIREKEKEQLKGINSQIDAINQLTHDEDMAIKESEYNSKRSDLVKELSKARAKKDIKKITDEIAELDAKHNREVLLDQRKTQIEALKIQADAIKEKADVEVKAKEKSMQNEIEKVQEQLKLDLNAQELRYNALVRANEKARDLEQDDFIKRESNLTEHYKKVASEDAIQAEARNLFLKGENDKIITLLNSYNPDWKSAGLSWGESLLQGLSSKASSIDEAIKSMLSKVRSVSFSGVNDSVIDFYGKTQEAIKQTVANVSKVATAPFSMVTPSVGVKDIYSGFAPSVMSGLSTNQTVIVNVDGRSIVDPLANRMVDKIATKTGYY